MKLTDVCDFQGGSQPPKSEWSFEAKDGDIAKITMDVANDKLSEEDCRIILRKYIK